MIFSCTNVPVSLSLSLILNALNRIRDRASYTAIMLHILYPLLTLSNGLIWHIPLRSQKGFGLENVLTKEVHTMFHSARQGRS